MHLDPRRIFPVFLIIILGLAAGAYYVEQNAASSRSFTYSGTIEATLIHLSSSVGGTIENVYVNEGNPVKTGDVLMEPLLWGEIYPGRQLQ